MRILLLETGDQGAAVNVFPEPQIPRLDNGGHEHHEDVGNLSQQRFGPSLKRIGKDRDLREASPHADKGTQAHRTEIFRHGAQDDVELFVAEVDFPLAENDRIGGI